MRCLRALLTFAALSAAVVAFVPASDALPIFAQRYGGSCRRCHGPFPRLTEAGEAFAANGFRRHGEEPRDTIATTDDLLVLGRSLPLSVRFESNVTWQGGDGYSPRTDFQTPYALKLISSAALSKDLSYYFYFYFFEHGEVGVEDAFVQWNDLGGKPIDLVLGQFQVSDPLFKRELRLELEDYAIYRARIGDTRADLTYDRGVLATWSPSRFEFAAAVVNGTGKRAADDGERFDTDAPKNVLGRASYTPALGMRVGGMVFGGWEDGDRGDGVVRADVRMAGVDATLSHGALELNGQWIRRTDRHSTFELGTPEATTDGGFVEAIWAPAESRWYGYGLWNRMECDQPLLDARLGGPENLTRWQTWSAGAGYLLQRNVRLQGEAGWDTESEAARLAFTFVTAF